MDPFYKLGCQYALQKLGGAGREMLQGALRGAGIGAVGGGLYGLHSGDPWDIARGAAIGAGTVGAAHGMGHVGRQVGLHRVMSRPELDMARSALKGKVGPERQAILQTIQKAHPTLVNNLVGGQLAGGVAGAAGGGILTHQLVSKD